MRNTRACFMHTCVGHVCVCVLARARVENLIQSAAKRGLILCAYPYEGVRVKTHAFTRSARINERQGYVRAPARENKGACINAFLTLSFFSATKLLATGEQRRILPNFTFASTVRDIIIQNMPGRMETTLWTNFAAKCKIDFYSASKFQLLLLSFNEEIKRSKI